MDGLKGSESRLNNFDLIRLFAALQVVLLHAVHHLQVPSESAAAGLARLLEYLPGVPIFFVISGFLISSSWERTPDVRRYAVGRLLRIYPALWVSFLVTVAVVVSFGAVDGTVVRSGSFWRWVAAQLSFLQFYNPPFLRSFGMGVINGSLWTIPVEIAFYVFLPFLYWGVVDRLSRTRADVVVGILAALSLAVQVVWLSGDHGEWNLGEKLLGVTLIPHLHLFLAGVLLQRNQAFVRRWLEGRVILWLAIFAGYIVLARAGSLFELPWRGIGELGQRGLLALLTVSAAFSGRALASRLLSGHDISYGVYLYHMVIVNTLIVLGVVGTVSALVLTFVVTIGMGSLSWWLVERPALRLKSLANGRAMRKVASSEGVRSS